MNVQYTHLYFMCLTTTFCFATRQEAIIKPGQNTDRENDVKKLLSSHHHLIISRGIYQSPDYPLCVRSHLISFSDVTFRHKLSYQEREFKGQKMRGIRLYRNAYYHVKKMRTVVLFVANVFIAAHQVDPRVSGSYNIYYANEKCFVAGTHLPGNTSTIESNALRNHTGGEGQASANQAVKRPRQLVAKRGQPSRDHDKQDQTESADDSVLRALMIYGTNTML
ncbi:uncharacterized protein [Dermacentor albipictus]|uniref:uncharacterized protein isoform X1 n=1 Tax=Dermacentor albipictus TaxID=60249 RepID=UPI0038FC1777